MNALSEQEQKELAQLRNEVDDWSEKATRRDAPPDARIRQYHAQQALTQYVNALRKAGKSA